MLVGVGVGLLIAPMRGQDMRNVLRQPFEELRGYLPENDQLNQYVQQVSSSVSQTTSDVKQTGQDVAQTTKQTAQSAKQSAQSGSSTRSTGTAPAPTAYPEYVNP